MPAVRAGAPARLLLAVELNGEEQADLADALQFPGNQLALGDDLLRRMRLRVPREDVVSFEGKQWHVLENLAGLKSKLDGSTQTLRLEASAEAFEASRITWSNTAAAKPTVSSTGGFLNYDVQMDRLDTGTMVGGLFDFGIFTKAGYGNSSWLVRHDSAVSQRTRLDTTWNVDMPERKESLRFGDAVGFPGSWGRSARFGGVQWGTNFATVPGFYPYAVPALRGEAVMPSTLDVFINDSFRAQSNVAPGPFELSNVPMLNGRGEIKLVTRDLLGREQTVVQPYYASTALLAPGQAQFSVELGKIRQDYGLASNRYGRSFVTATRRAGITPELTWEGRAEVLPGQQTLGLGATGLLGSFGTLGLHGAASRGNAGAAVNAGTTGSVPVISTPTGNAGAMVGADLVVQSEKSSLSVQSMYASRAFVALGQLPENNPKLTLSVGLGVPTPIGAVRAVMAHQRYWTEEPRTIASLNYSQKLSQRDFLVLSATRQFGTIKATAVSLTLIHNFDNQTSVASTASREVNGDAPGRNRLMTQLQRSVPSGPGFGYQIDAEPGSEGRSSAQGTWNTDHTTLVGGVARTAGSSAQRLGASGSVALIDGGVYLSRRIEDSFAVVHVGGFPNVGVALENQPVARTDAKGDAFISGLRAFEKNHLSFDQADLPFDVEIDAVSMTVAPPRRSGVAVSFPVRRQRAASLKLVLEESVPDSAGTGNAASDAGKAQVTRKVIPAGSIITLAGSDQSMVVGFGGRVFLENYDDKVDQVLEWSDRRCIIHARAGTTGKGGAGEAAPAILPDLGTVICRKAGSAP